MAAIAVATTLSGCVTWEKPELETVPPDRFREAGKSSAPSIEEAKAFSARFGSPELSRLLDQALGQNIDVQVSAARILQAQAQARIASATLWPALTASTSTGAWRYPPGTVINGTLLPTISRQNFLSLGLNASYEIDFWGKNQDASKAAHLLAAASRFDYDVVEIATVASVMNVYFQVLTMQDRLRVVREHNKIAGTVLDSIREKLTAGAATKLDYLQQETVWAAQRAMIPPLEQALRQGKNQLAILTGQMPEHAVIRGGSLVTLRFPDIDPGLPSEVLLRRPDVAEAETILCSQEFSVLEARAALFPSIQLTGQSGIQDIVLKNAWRPDTIGWGIVGGLIQPLLDGDRLRSQLELQKGRYTEQAALYRKQILIALSEVENALAAVKEISRQLQLQTEAVAAARAAYAAAEERLKDGVIDILSLATTETALFQSEDALEQIRLQRFQAAATLYQALGGGWSRTTRDAEVARANEAYALGPAPTRM